MSVEQLDAIAKNLTKARNTHRARKRTKSTVEFTKKPKKRRKSASTKSKRRKSKKAKISASSGDLDESINVGDTVGI